MKGPRYRVYVVDDDPAVRKALARLLDSSGYDAIAFNSAREFMERYQEGTPGCLVLDISMPGVTGLELQRWLLQKNSPIPIIFLTGRGDIPMSVQAIKSGAVDFLTKPVSETDLISAVEEAVKRDREVRSALAELRGIRARLATLTPREREVLEHVVSGQLNKQIAAELGTVEKTIKVHRARVMEKMGVQSLAELARIAERTGIGQPPAPTSTASPWRGSAELRPDEAGRRRVI
jgi:FixJ family two-component response regulator